MIISLYFPREVWSFSFDSKSEGPISRWNCFPSCFYLAVAIRLTESETSCYISDQQSLRSRCPPFWETSRGKWRYPVSISASLFRESECLLGCFFKYECGTLSKHTHTHTRYKTNDSFVQNEERKRITLEPWIYTTIDTRDQKFEIKTKSLANFFNSKLIL